MSEVTFIRAYPRDPATGVEVGVRIAGGGAARAYYWAGDHYRAGVANRPRFSAALAFNEKGWTGGTVPSTAAISFAPSDPALRDTLASYYWPEARIEVDSGDEASDPPRVLNGTVADITFADGVFNITVSDLSNGYDRKMLATGFAGTGGLEGYSGAAGRAKRRSWGKVRNIEGRLLIATDNIYEFGDPSFALNAFTALRDKGRDGPMTTIAWAGSPAATLAALIASTPPAGGGAGAPSIACAKWWTQPSGPLTADIEGEIGTGYADTVPAIVNRLVVLAGGTGVGNLSEALTLRPAVAGIHVDDDNETWSAAIDRILLGASLLWKMSGTGAITLKEWSFGSPAASLRALFISRESSLQPTKTRTLTYRRNHRVHSDGEISAAILADDVTYADGTPVEDLKPAQPAADVTAQAQVEIVRPADQVVYRDWQGTVKTGQFSRTLTVLVTRGGTDIRTADDVTYAITASGVTATINTATGSADKGRITVTAGGAGSIVLTVTVGGIARTPQTITFRTEDDTPPINNGSSGGTDSSLAPVSGTGFTQMSSVDSGETLLTVTLTSGQSLNATATVDYSWSRSTGVSFNSLRAKARYRLVGAGSWTDFSAGVETGSNATWNAADFSGDPGSLTLLHSQTGLAAGTYEVSLWGAKNTSLGNAITINSGSFTASRS